MMKNYSEYELRKISNQELEKELLSHEWLHRDLLHEYDARCHDGRIQFRGPVIEPDQIEEYIRNKYAERKKKKAG